MQDEKVFTDLFEAMATELLQKIESGEATAADLSVARQFLKDNGINASTRQSDPLANLALTLPFDPEADISESA